MVLPCGAIGLPSGGSCEKFQWDRSHNGGGDRNFIFFSPFCEEPVIKQRIPGTRCPAVRPPTGIGLVCLQHRPEFESEPSLFPKRKWDI